MARHFVPDFITIRPGPTPGDCILGNDATGQFFRINAATSRFLDALRSSESLGHAAGVAGLDLVAAQAITAQMLRGGVIVERGRTHAPAAKATPLESRAMTVRIDLLDGGGLLRRFTALGRFAFSRAGFALWLAMIATMIALVLDNPEKAWLSLRQIRDYGLADVAIFTGIYIALKIVHESGHGMAYRIMCLREGLEPGPIRMGISIFALTPFAFTDVTAAWRIRSRWRRAAIAAGGLYFELFAIALMTVFWAFTSPDRLQNALFQAGTFTALSSVLFNLNPFIKLDGYYMMTDLRGTFNLTTRASRAALASFARAFGAPLPPPPRLDLAYWALSYLYRWSLFGGIFLVAWVFDRRFAGLVGAAIVMMLVVRPLVRSMQFTRKQELRPVRAGLTLALLLGLGLVLLVPLPNRVRVEGRLSRHETHYVYATEPGILALQADALQLENADLDYELLQAVLQVQVLQNAARAVARSGAERARLETDLSRVAAIRDALARRQSETRVAFDAAADWTPLAARALQGAMLDPALMAKPLGALSDPAPPRIRLWLPEAEIEAPLPAETPIALRLRADPACRFSARLIGDPASRTAREGHLPLLARPDPLPPCAASAADGSALVARLPAPPRSIFSHIVHELRQLLQNRLPVLGKS